LTRSMSCRILLISCSEGDGGCAYLFIGAAGGGQLFPGAQQVVEAGGQVEQVEQEEALNAGRGRADRLPERAARGERAAQVIALK
jgi:hypothetical protein